MDILFDNSNRRLEGISLDYQRDEISQYPWELQLLGIEGSRGIGKTTLFLQHMKQHYKSGEAIYLSLDDIYFTQHQLVDVVREFHRRGGRRIYIDEVHKYPNWSIEIKNIYDNYGDLKVAFTGSSMSYIQSGNADLSRRAIMRRMQGLSFRQFINIQRAKRGSKHPPIQRYTLEDILENTNDIIREVTKDNFKPYAYFQKYLEHGYYPFFMEGLTYFPDKLSGTTRAVLEADFAQLHNVTAVNVRSIYQLLYAISTSPPYQPNIEKLSKRIGIARKTLLEYIHHLSRADILTLLKDPQKGLSILKKPNKIYLENTNLLYNFAPRDLQMGTVRETFVMNQLKYGHDLHYPQSGDVLVNEKYTFEIGGKNKTTKQINDIENAYILADDIDHRVHNKIPMWMVGMLY